jgi:hypothetical protein
MSPCQPKNRTFKSGLPSSSKLGVAIYVKYKSKNVTTKNDVTERIKPALLLVFIS